MWEQNNFHRQKRHRTPRQLPEDRKRNPRKYIGPGCSAKAKNRVPSSGHMRQFRLVTGELQRIVGLYRATDFSAAAVVKRPDTVLALASAQICGEFGFEIPVDLAHVVHHQNILGGNGTIGLELETPGAFGVLRAEKRALGAPDRALEFG